ncbi:MAG TPA: hypothetical protein VGK19_25100 [Capsulimonadaceae bacterium]
MKVRDMRAGSDGIWFILEPAVATSGRLLVKSDISGNARIVATIPPDTRLVGLTGTARGAATVLVTKTQRTLTEFSVTGERLQSVSVGCYTAEGLVTIEGKAATVCPDGTITRYDGTTAQKYSSWARPGTIPLIVGNRTLAVVDRATVGILLNDIQAGTLSLVKPDVPEIADSLKRIATAQASAAATARPGEAPFGTPLAVMDAVSDGMGLYLLIYPYHVPSGPTVVRLDSKGVPTARYRCVTGGDASVHKIAVKDGYLILCSVNGSVYTFKL